MIQIIKKDLKRNFIFIIIVSILILLYLYFVIFPNLIYGYEIENKVKINLYNFNKNIMEYKAFLIFVFLIGIFSSIIFSSEIELKNIEFLYSLRISRKKIFVSKLMFLIMVYIFFILLYNIFIEIFSYYKFNKVSYIFFFKNIIINLPLGFFIFSISLFSSLFIIKRLLSISIPILLYFSLNSLSFQFSKNLILKDSKIFDLLKFISPIHLLRYTKYPILFYKKNDINFIIYSIPAIVIGIIFLILAYIRFCKMDFDI